jgi:transcriptional regulator with XRE-family HTH domain
MLNLMAPPMKKLSASQQMKLYRRFLNLTQAQLAAALGTTQTSVARWESDNTPISLMTMGHMRALVTARIAEAIRRLFTDLIPKLTLSEFDGLFGNPDTVFSEDATGCLYLGSVFIEGYRQHSLHMRLEDRTWYALDRDGSASEVDEAFLGHVISAGRSIKQKSITK